MTRILVCDIGNSQMVFGLFADARLRGRWRLSSKHGTADELAWQLHGMFSQWGEPTTQIAGIIAASVVPQLDDILSEACERICGQRPVFVGSDDVRTGMAIDYKHPREVGADRIVNAVAAHARYGAPVIVLDCGTATTFDIVSPAGHYAGGLILPGIEVASEALSARAAKLPAFSPRPVPFGIGRDTISSMQIGSYWGAIAALDGIIGRLHAMPGYAEAPVVATGGISRMLIDDLTSITAHEPDLTLDGLHMLGQRHFQRAP